MIKILGIGGSPRKGGNSDILLQQILEGVRESGGLLEEVQLRDFNILPCIACERCRKDGCCTGLADDMQLLYPRLREADGLVLVSPVYSYNVSAIMKAFIDRLYCFYQFGNERPGSWSSQLAGQGKKAVITMVGEQREAGGGGMDLAFETVRRSLLALGYEITDELPVFGVFHRGEVRKYSDILERARACGQLLAEWR